MSKTTLITTLFVFLISYGFTQTVIYQEDFSGYADGTISGNGWGATANPDCDDGGINNGGNEWGVFGGQFVANDIEGGGCCSSGGGTGGANRATFSLTVPITGYSCVEASLETGGSGSLECDYSTPTFVCDNSHDQMVVEYQVDGGAWNLIAYICGDQGLGGISVSGLSGTTLRIRIQIGNKANDEFYWIDNIRVTGSAITKPTISGPSTVCDGGASITLTATAGFSSYHWSNGDSGSSISINTPGTYTVTVTNAAGCEIVSNPKTVTAAAPPSVNITGPTSVCSSGGSITLDAGAGFSSYQWSTGQSSRTISINSSGTYSVTVTNAAGCTGEDDHTVDINLRPSLDNPGTLSDCGSVTLPVISGTFLSGNVYYSSGPNGTGTRYAEGAQITSSRTIYIFAGTAGCSDQEAFSVNITPKPNIVPINDVIACNSYTLPTVPGPNLPANKGYYTGPNGTGTKYNAGDVITTSRTLYAYAGTSDCFDEESFKITIQQGVNVNDIADQSACASFTLPTITGTGLSGNEAYYTQPNGAGTRYVAGQAITSTQTLYIYDGTPTCNDEESFNITITGGPNINGIPDQTVCNAYTLPAITGANLSGNQAYFTQPSGGGIRFNEGDVITTSQTLYIYDSDGSCSDEKSFKISIATTPDITPIADPTVCGFYILPTISGTNLSGSEAYFTQANGSGTRYEAGDTIRTSTALFLYDGAVGCSDEETVNINILSPPVLDAITDQTACQFYVFPTISGVNLSGNQAFYTQSNRGGTRYATGDTIYSNTTLYIFDDNGSCTDEKSFMVRVNQPPAINPIADQSGCEFFVLPTITGNNLSGNEAYFTQTNGGGTRYVAGDTIRNSMTLYAFDSKNGCTDEKYFNITINTLPTASATSHSVRCNGDANGAIELTVVGSAPFTFNWEIDTLDGQQNVTGLPAGTYNVTVTDSNTCSTTVQAIIAQPELLDITCSQLMPTSGNGLSDGQAQIIITGGMAAYTVSWSGPSNGTQTLASADTLVINNLLAGSYEVTVTDRNNCSASCNFAINVAGCNITLDATATDASCSNASDGSIQVTVTGGTDPLNFDWNVDTLDGIEDPTGLAPGIYVLNVTDGNNCILTQSITVNAQATAPTAILAAGGTICEGDCFTFNATLGGTAPFTLAYQIDFGAGPLPGTFTTDKTSDTIQICPADFGIRNGSIILTLLSISDANCQTTLSQSDTIIINSIMRDTIQTTLCEGESVTVNGTIYNQNNPSGTEIIPGGSTNGCDSIVVVNLSFYPPIVFNLNPTLCEGESLVVNGIVYNQGHPSGTEVISGAAANGCDSTIIVDLSFYQPAIYNLNQTLCEDENIVVNGTTFDQHNPSGTEILAGASSNGCDSIVNVNLTFLSKPVFDLNQTLCDGESATVNGTIYNQNNPSGTETLMGAAANGCDSIVNISLNFYPAALFDLNQTLCEGDSVVVNGTTYNQSNLTGTEILAGASATGCDSTVNIHLRYIFPSRTVIDSTLCPGESLIVNDVTYNENTPSGTEVIPGGSANGCDSIIQVNLQFLAPAVANLTQTLCDGESITVNGRIYDQAHPSGTEIFPGGSVHGCDSTVNVNLNFYPPAVLNLTQTLCPGESLTINGTVYNQNNPNGTEVLANASATGCDSLIKVRLNFYAPAVLDLNQTLCEGDSVVVNGKTYNQADPRGTEVLAGASINGCDSTIHVNLIYSSPSIHTIDTMLCAGTSMLINNKVYDANNPTGTEVIAGGSANGCDSIIQVNLRFAPEIIGSIEGDTTICAGESATLTFRLTGASSFDVRYSDGFQPAIESRNISDGYTVQVSPTQTSTYAFELIAVNGSACPAQIGRSATIQVSNLSAQATLESNFGGFGVSCSDAVDGVIAASATKGIAPFVYTWNTGATGRELVGIGAGAYSLTITDAAGCTDADSIILVEPSEIVVNSSTRDPLCSSDKTGAIIIDSVSGGAPPYEVSLNQNSYRAIHAFPFELNNLAAGNYNFYLRDANDCEIQLNTTIVAITDPKVNLGEDVTVKLGDSLELEGIVNFVPSKIEWRPDTFLSVANTLQTVVTPTENTTYTLTVSDTSGCKASDIINVFVNKERGVYIPTAFSPDGDGNNDVFYIFGGNDVVRIKKFIVFDRWGNLLYQQGEFVPNDPQYGWNGKFNGQDVNIGVYVYYAEIEFIDGFTETFQGDVAVVR